MLGDGGHEAAGEEALVLQEPDVPGNEEVAVLQGQVEEVVDELFVLLGGVLVGAGVGDGVGDGLDVGMDLVVGEVPVLLEGLADEGV